MTSPLDSLLEEVPPPAQPCNPGIGSEWARVEAYFGLSLPDDYKRLLDHYGSGTWGGYLWVLNPFSVNRYLNPRLIIEGSHLWCAVEPDPPSSNSEFLVAWEGCRRWARTRRQASPYPFFPDRPGLFPWASSRHEEHCLYWLAGEGPGAWPVVSEAGSEERRFSQPMNFGCSEFLIRWLRGERLPEGFPPPAADEQGRMFAPQWPNPLFLEAYSWQTDRLA